MISVKLNKKGKFVWFIVAYLPLFFALLIKFFFSQNFECSILKLEIILIVSIILLGFLIGFIKILRYNEDTNPRPTKCEIIQSKNTEYVLFVVSYLIPFYNINFTLADIIPTILMLVIIGILYVRTPLFAVNPILNLLNYNLYNAKELNEKNEIIIISQEKLLLTCYETKLIQLGDGIYISNKIKECKNNV